MHWFRRRHWLHVQGNLGGLRYEGRFGVFQLADMGEAKRPLMVSAPAGDRARAFALQVWESEGGAVLLREGSTHRRGDPDLNLLGPS
jgi:hypothetical protein